MARKFKRVIGFIADTHIFSRYALNPPEFITREEIKIEVNGPGLKAIYNHWVDFCKICDEEDVDTVFAVGDLLHGQNVIERGTLLLSANMDEQEDAACQVLKMIVGKRKFYGISGSGYHTSTKGHSTEKDVIEKLGGKFLGPICNIRFTPSQRVFNIAHGESASFQYRETVLGRQGKNMREALAMGKIPRVDVFVRAHWHSYVLIHEKGMQMIQLPGWLPFEPSKPYLKDYGAMQGDVGGVIVKIDSQDRIIVHHYLLDDHPHICDAVQSA